jgi:signal transduction histidine kinase
MSITDQNNAQKQLLEAQTEFVSFASHALRTPLGISKWYLEALQADESFKEVPDLVKDYVKEIYKNNERLLTLVRNLLSVSRIDSGKTTDAPALTDVKEIINNAVKDVSVTLAKNNIQLHKQFDTIDIPQVFVSPTKLQEVVENLIANAIKYNNPHGQITVLLTKKDDVIVINVTDHGIGISQEDQKKIFTKFFRSEKAIKKNTEGSGLGLYVVKSYVEGWGGTVSVNSIEGQGATFTLTIPLNHKKTQSIKTKEVMI